MAKDYKDFFDTTTTKIIRYDDLLNNDYIKGLNDPYDGNYKLEIIEMTPNEYKIECCSVMNWGLKDYEQGMDLQKVDDFVNDMKANQKFPLPYIDYIKNGQEGRHRAEAALRMNLKYIPVLVVKRETEIPVPKYFTNIERRSNGKTTIKEWLIYTRIRTKSIFKKLINKK